MVGSLAFETRSTKSETDSPPKGSIRKEGPADWELPAGFPDPDAPVRGMHRGKLAFLLRGDERKLRAISAVGGL